MFSFSPKTSFGPAINVIPSRVIVLPQTKGAGRDHVRSFPASSAVVTQCSSEMLEAARCMDGGQVRLASLQVRDAWFGIAMVSGSGHFAGALFDLSDENCKSLTQQALVTGEVHLLLSHGDEFVLLVPKLTSGSRHAFSMAGNCRPATVDEFTRAVQSFESALGKAETWRQMNVDHTCLQSITLSVCVPGLDVVPELDIRHAGDIPHYMH